jgi:phosphate butyryltransferase
MYLQSYLSQLLPKSSKPVIAVACAEDEEVLIALDFLCRQNLVEAVLVGNQELIERITLQHALQLQCSIIDCRNPEESVKIAIACVHNNQADMLMKGQIATKTLLKAVLDRQDGLRKDALLSHVSIVNLDKRLVVFADGAMNINPTIEQKQTIIDQCCEVAYRCQLPSMHVGIICAVEKVSDKMPCTSDAVILKDYRPKYPQAIIDGPFALDNALSLKAAQTKGISSKIAGDVNVLIMPNIETGNVFYKTLAFVANKEVAGIIMGAKVPIIMTSRADSHMTKINAILLACVCAINANDELT